MIGRFHNWTDITSKNDSQIFNTVAKIGINNGWYSSSGTVWDDRAYIKESFKAFNFNISCNQYTPDMYNIKYFIDSYRPFLLGLTKEYYGEPHAVAGYAYTRLKSSSTGYTSSYLKIADGNSTNGRYLSISQLQSGKSLISSIEY